ncbi:hypothetical protein [Haloferax sp. YSSS75]|uniref:hypothetical protein n=1 Tax=Haloferax sp. YSSS75 TaxID=3388564 RepID=UPI00398D01B1
MDRRAFLALAVTSGVSLAGCGFSVVRVARVARVDAAETASDDDASAPNHGHDCATGTDRATTLVE